MSERKISISVSSFRYEDGSKEWAVHVSRVTPEAWAYARHEGGTFFVTATEEKATALAKAIEAAIRQHASEEVWDQ